MLTAFLGMALAAPLSVSAPAFADETVPWGHGISMHGKPALPEGFTHFPYANPDAPKGGRIRLGVQGTFDSLNQFILKGAWTSARGMKERQMGQNIFESLLIRSNDEAFTLYGHLAEAVRMPDERNWIEFRLNPAAKFSNDKPVTVEDVEFSLKIMSEKGRPPFKGWYSRITEFERTGERSIKLHFADGKDRELPLLIALAPIFSKSDTNPDTFDQSTLVPPVGSGPYTFKEVDPGRRVVYERDPDYWAKDLPVKVGFDNFDVISIDYFRDSNALLEAFKKGDVEALQIGNPATWETGFDFPAFNEGRVVKDVFEKGTPAPMLGLAFNTRRPQFQDKRVRQALGMLVDFDFINRTLFRGLYQRTAGYWDNSELSSIGQPASAQERDLLAEFEGAVDSDVMDGTWRPSQADGSGRDRAVLRGALSLLQEAGYKLQDRKLVNAETGEPLSFEILVRTQDEERVALTLQRTMKLVGVDMQVRSVDASQFEERRFNFDFDMLFNSWSASLSPGGEQYARWSSEAADIKGSRNIVGAKEPALDALIDAMVAARSREDFVAAVRAMDRVLISGAYAIPLYHVPNEWVGRWTTLEHPEKSPTYGHQYDNWWSATASQ
ncbi:extracellular solute-binding protein [Pseudovibrio sp. SPO723]|uniref:extracellular solute-binding protein n=1 Tax=Nesiotobacter zosterae TaxID=392721 RepID=UPI0029C22242|nr:extracellular solute-binding protein [Pseudovibrio sp. SPO723]MDX5592860.1 extracellular solute-binding protein [Pseudovibrio sp. SPO723]